MSNYIKSRLAISIVCFLISGFLHSAGFAADFDSEASSEKAYLDSEASSEETYLPGSVDLILSGRALDEDLGNIAKDCPDLKSLDISHCYQSYNRERPRHSYFMIKIAKYCPDFESLKAYNQRDVITNDFLIEFSKECPKLKNLNIQECYDIRDVAICAVAENCPLLECLNIAWCHCTPMSILRIVQMCPNLRSLDIAKNDGFNDAAIIEISRHCPLLEELELFGCSFFDHITDVSISEVARTHPGLKKLGVGESDVTDEGLYAIAEHCKGLKSLCTSWSVKVSDAGIIRIAENCLQLKELRICKHSSYGRSVVYFVITDAAMNAVAEHLTLLEDLDINGSAVTDDCISMIRQNCVNLKHLSANPRPITDPNLITSANEIH
jgi:hypothetical protein